MALPQLKIRSEFSFRRAFGSPAAVVERLKAIGSPVGGLVDQNGSTWGHVRLEKAAKAAGIQPAFGAEWHIDIDDEFGRWRKFGTDRPTAWALAEDIAAFYKFSSSAPSLPEHFAAAKGIITFSGSALTDPACFDYIDLTPTSIRECKRRIDLFKRTCRPYVLVGDNHFPAPGDRAKYLALNDGKKTTPQWILSDDEMRQAFWFLPDDVYHCAWMNTMEVAERLQGVKLRQAPIINVPGDLVALIEEGRKYRLAAGHLKDWPEAYQQRLDREIAMIKEKQFESYFIVVSDLVVWAKERMLVGPARGSSAGSLVCYLLRITEVDPLVHGLLFERFIDINRNDLPDIDIDFNDQKRELCFTYLAEKYGAENVSRIGNINTLKPRSVMAEVGKKMAIPANATFAIKNVLIEYSSGDSRYGKGLEDTMNNTKPGQDFSRQYPEAAVMGEVEGTAWHTGVHAAGLIVSNEPVTSYCTVKDGVAQLDKPDTEYLNLLKIDVLGLRTLGVIEDSGCVTAEQLYALTLDDPEVLRIFDEHKFSGVFQFEGAAQRRVSIQVPMTDFKHIDHVTALARPGPLGGGAANTYINRNTGREEFSVRHELLLPIVKDTHGVVLYQEQVMRIVREIGQFSWEDTSMIRKAMSGRKGTEYFDQKGKQFVKGAAEQNIDQETAKKIWEEICSFGAWGMNASHTCSYAIISYWCAYMKRYHTMEYAAACLRNAKDDEQVVEILRELSDEGIGFVPFDPVLSERNWCAKDGKLVGGFTNLVGIGPAKAELYVQKRASEGLTEADLAKLKTFPVKNNDLRPAHTLWGRAYEDPSVYNVAGRIKEFAALEDFENAVVICKVIRKERRDENEAVRLARRGGERKAGQTQFLDVFVVDDSVSKPIVMRIKAKHWNEFGERLADRAVDGQDWFLVRGKWLHQFSMLTVEKIKCLTNPEMFS
jgi:DNA polymerase III alpha subunit